MIAKDGQPAESDSQSNYEAAVLDFLDNEMVDVQSTLTEKKQSEELDALVADLLHQVMTESEQAQTGEMIVSSENMKDLLAEFMPQQNTISLPESEHTSPDPAAVQTESLSSEHEDSLRQEVVESPVPESPIAQTPEVEASTPISGGNICIPGGTEKQDAHDRRCCGLHAGCDRNCRLLLSWIIGQAAKLRISGRRAGRNCSCEGSPDCADFSSSCRETHRLHGSFLLLPTRNRQQLTPKLRLLLPTMQKTPVSQIDATAG